MFLGGDARAGFFFRAWQPVLSVPVFLALLSVGFSKQNGWVFTGCGRPQAASMPHRAKPGILAWFPLGLLHSAKKNSAEIEARKTGTDSTGCHARKKNPARAGMTVVR